MADRILVTLDDLETAVPLNAALEAAGFATGTFSAHDDARNTLRREQPDLVVLTGAVYERPAQHLAAWARDHEISTLAVLERTDRDAPD
jgi:DNA-binding response OmpR family regulator